MDIQISTALITASGVVLAAIIAALVKFIIFKKKSKKNLETSPKSNITVGKNNTIVGDVSGGNVMINSSINQIEPKKSILAFASHKVDSNYVLNVETESQEDENGFSMINVRIINEGRLDAAVTKLRITVKDYIVNREPHLTFPSYVENGILFIDVFNNGWGDSKNTNFSILFFEGHCRAEDEKLETDCCINNNRYYKEFENTVDVLSNQRVNLFAIKSKYLNSFQKRISISAIVVYQEKGEIKASNIFIDPKELGVYHTIALFEDGFEQYEERMPGAYGYPDTVYATIIDENTDIKEYDISREIKSGCIDDFNIYVGSQKSCEFKIILSLIYNRNEVLESDEIPIFINRYTDSKTYKEYIDGCEIALKNFRKKNKIEKL